MEINYYSGDFFPWDGSGRETRIMVFVDGENFAIRFKELLNSNSPKKHISYSPDVYLWSHLLNHVLTKNYTIIRKYYYTCVIGDKLKVENMEDDLKKIGIEAPRVFKKDKNRKTKMVDITLSTDMLTHAFRDNYDVALLVAGDEDYLPLIEAVQMEGKKVFGWFVSSGIGRNIKNKYDFYFDLTEFLLNDVKIFP